MATASLHRSPQAEVFRIFRSCSVYDRTLDPDTKGENLPMNPIASVSISSSTPSVPEEDLPEIFSKATSLSVGGKPSQEPILSSAKTGRTGWISWMKSWFSSATPPALMPVDLDPVALSSTPLLDPPVHSLSLPLSRETRLTDAMLDPLLLQAIASHMKEITVQEIFTLVMASEMSLDQERASIVNDSEKIALRIKKLQDLNTEKVLAILQKDEQLAQFFTLGNKAAATLTFVAACAAFFIPPAAAFTYLQAALGIGSLITSIGGGISQYRLEETKQQVSVLAHARKRSEDQLDETRSRLMSIAENHGAMQQQFVYYIKSIFKLSSIINAKN